MKALVINCTLKSSPERSNTTALADIVAEALQQENVEVSEVRAADHSIPPGVESDMGEGDEWPGIRTQILESEILIFATPTWLGRPSSFAQRVLERMDAMIAETDDEERTRCIQPRCRRCGHRQRGRGSSRDLRGLGCPRRYRFTIPGQAWTYWNRGPGPGDDYLESDAGKEWSHSTGKAAASNLLAAARALSAHPIPAPPSE